MTRARALISITGVCALVLFVARAGAHDPITTKVTWSREIVRIVNNRCAGCHMKDGAGLFPLETYEQTKSWAKAIKDEVVSRRMPPWPAARGFGEFSNDPTLSPFEISLVAAWVDGGAPKGEAKDLPVARSHDASPRPDVILQLPARTVAPSGEPHIEMVSTNIDRDCWILGWTFVPNDPAIVRVEFHLVTSNELLDVWTPPERAVAFPAGAGQRVPANERVRTTIYYRSARQQQDFPATLPLRAPELGLFTQRQMPVRLVGHLHLGCNTEMMTLHAPSPRLSVFGIRVDEAPFGTAIGLVLGEWGTPAAWLPTYSAAYRPTLRFSAVQPSSLKDIEAVTVNQSVPCSVTWNYVADPKTWALIHGTSTTKGTVNNLPPRWN